jgi:acyl-CoA synthetase (NDP forming)
VSSSKQSVDAIDRIFKARSVAVVGASAEPHKFGFMTLNSLISGGYEGRIYPVNPRGGEILGLRAYVSIREIPGELDVAVVIVPAKFVPEVLREAGEKGVRGAIIQSAGFREAGRADLEAEIISISRKYGIRLMGPNIQGVNYLPNKLCAMFFPVIKTSGPLAIISQSGTVTTALSEWAADEGLGISGAVNLGNQVDLCESDYIDFFATDENTKAIVLYLEGVKEGRRFLETVNRVAPEKPVVILKSGRTDAGQRSAASHTGSMASNHNVFEAACRQFGAVSADSIEALYDHAKALATMGQPKGDRVLTISTSGGACTLAVDEAGPRGLVVPELSRQFIEGLEQLELPALASLSNPIDLISLDSEDFVKVALLADKFDVADVILISFGDPVSGAIEALKYLQGNIKTSIAVSYMGGGEEEKLGRVKMQEACIPVFPTPERAVCGIAAAVRYAEYRRTRKSDSHVFPVRKKRQDKVDSEANFILEPEAVNRLAPLNIPYPAHGLARDAYAALDIADSIGYPVVMKIVSPNISHKSDVGGVILDLKNPEDVIDGYNQILHSVCSAVPDASIEGVLVCRQVPDGVDVIIGGMDDPVFGSTIMFGLGGIFTEVLKDVAFRIAPIIRTDVEEMIKEIKGYSILTGFRGQKAVDIDQLIDLLLAVSELISKNNNIKELDLNPVRLYENGQMVLDVRIMERSKYSNEGTKVDSSGSDYRCGHNTLANPVHPHNTG